ncbi:MAG: hypothetical protein CML68_15245 [Rhodobacteraceae bacterium]|nr:hypothetical protein [Paracoccaceae bacterium]
MLVFSAQSLAFIAVPKTGTTAVELALRPHADIIFTKHRKHMTAQKFHNRVAPFLAKNFDLRPDRMAVLRDPEEQIRSWYRYRKGARQKGSSKSTFELSFDAFVRDVISDDPPPHAGIGSQWNMVTSKGSVLVHHLFAYERQPVFRDFLDDRFGGPVDIKARNVSPPAEAPLDEATAKALRRKRAKEFDLYARILDAGGHLVTDV